MDDLVEVLASTATPFIAVLIITDSDSAFGRHLWLLLFLLDDIFCLSFAVGHFGSD